MEEFEVILLPSEEEVSRNMEIKQPSALLRSAFCLQSDERNHGRPVELCSI